MIVLLTLVGLAVAQDCDTSATTVDLAREVAAAEAAFVAMDPDGFQVSEQAVMAILPCITEPMTAVDAAGVHRLNALRSFAEGDLAATEASYRTVLAIQPAWALSERMAPVGSPLNQAYEAAKSAPESSMQALDPPRATSLSVDGTPASDRPWERPFVLQAQANSGEVTHTDWFDVAATLPSWAERPPELAKPAKNRTRRPVFLLGAAVGSAVLAGGAYGAAWSGRAKYKNPDTAMTDLEGIQGRTNSAVLLATGFGGVALGTGFAVGATW